MSILPATLLSLLNFLTVPLHSSLFFWSLIKTFRLSPKLATEKNMTILITTGNLTKDAEVKTANDGKKYVLFQIAENVYKRDTNGKILKDAEGKYISSQTMFYSVFVNDKTGALTASALIKGQAVKMIGKARIKLEKDSNGYDQYIINGISALNIDTDPFNKLSETDNMASQRIYLK